MRRYSGLKENQPSTPTSSSGTSLSTVSTFCARPNAPIPRRLIRVQSQMAPMAVATISTGSRRAGMNTCR
ncbi:hypothetical protein D3C75_1310540 [compost metagenome]